MERLLTRMEAAKQLGICVSTLDEIRACGQIQYIQRKKNSSVFFTEADLAEYVARSTHKAHTNVPRQTYRSKRGF